MSAIKKLEVKHLIESNSLEQTKSEQRVPANQVIADSEEERSPSLK
jgi:hypothetical protein